MIITLMITTYLPILCVICMLTKAHQPQTSVHNKNVNIIVNLDAKNIAKELWKLMKYRLSNSTNNINEQDIIEDLQNAVMPFVLPTKRSMLYAYQVATDLDQIIRITYTRNFPNMNVLDIEITTRNIVANMMAKLKILLSKNLDKLHSDEVDFFSRRMIPDSRIDSKQDDYLDIKIKICKKDILMALQ